MPAAVKRVGDGIGDAGHLGFVLPKAAHGGGRVSDDFRARDLVVIRGDGEVGSIPLREVQHPVREFDVAIACPLGLSQRLQETLVADTVEFARDGFDANVGAHGRPP